MAEARFWAASVEKINFFTKLAAGSLIADEIGASGAGAAPAEIQVSSFRDFNY